MISGQGPATYIFVVQYQIVIFFKYCDLKIVAPNNFASFFVLVLLVGLFLLFCVSSHIVIALPTIATVIVVALLRS